MMYKGWNKENSAGNWKHRIWRGKPGSQNREEKSGAGTEPKETWDIAEREVFVCWM